MGLFDRFQAQQPRGPASVAPAASGSATSRLDAVVPGNAPMSVPPEESSLISEVTPSGLHPAFKDSRQPLPPRPHVDPPPVLPLIGERPVGQQQHILLALIIVGLSAIIVSLWLGVGSSQRTAQRLTAVAQAQIQVQRAAKAATQALLGTPSAFAELRLSTQSLSRGLRALRQGDPQVPAASAEMAGALQPLAEASARLEQHARAVADNEQPLLSVHGQAAQTGLSAAELAAALNTARQAHAGVVLQADTLSTGLEGLQSQLRTGAGLGLQHGVGAVLGGVLLLIGAAGLLRLFVLEQTRRSYEAEEQRSEAERQEREAKRVNDANQSAILRLMNELQSVAEGDLTQQATVTEDITGAIADSVNYTVEELRSLAAQVQNVVRRVMRTTQQVEHTSTELLAASAEQLREIRETGESVLKMASSINEVSAQAQSSAEVARQSLQAAGGGMAAVQNTIGGMNAIRDQIQETSKRIKRLGESSQEIGEITELITDITEQTHVLALNAAIQAASAGEAGRGFSVVAEEVQRLAERSGDASRQIAALVRAIQTDTQDAVAAMERSTYGVVEGARLSDAAGHALQDIQRVTRELATLIERISAQASREAQSANIVASNIQHIFAVTEQTSQGTQSTAQIVRELSRTAEELRASVARFKVS